MREAPRPYALLAELTYRCPLQCVYCSNPLTFAQESNELTTEVWRRVFAEAKALGVMHLHLSGGEPLARRDIVELVQAGHEAGLYTNLITSGVSLTPQKLAALHGAGLDHVQLSMQDVDAAAADRVAGSAAHSRKRLAAGWVLAAGLPLTINIVLHRLNIDRVPALIAMAVELGADRLELANTQYYAWALENRHLLLPSREQVEAAEAAVLAWRTAPTAELEIAFVKADYYADYPKPCMDGWARRTVCVTPTGLVLPCQAAQVIPGMVFDSITNQSLGTVWRDSPALNAFRGEGWMQPPCVECPRRSIDFGGCRCQALLLTGDARAADPVCHLSPHRTEIDRAIATAQAGTRPLTYRTVANSCTSGAPALP